MFSLTGQAADRLQEFPLQIPLSVEGEGPWYRLSVPMNVQLASRHADLRDLRVFNAAGEPLAYSLVGARSRQENTLETHQVRSFPLYADGSQGSTPRVDVRVQRNADGTLVEVTTSTQESTPAADKVRSGWLLDCSAIDRPLERLVLDWAEVEGFQRFSIEASDDLDHWHSWGEGRLTRLRFGGEQVEQREVRLPDRKARYLRLLWKLPTQAPELREVQLQSSTTSQRPAPIIWTEALPGQQTGELEYVWELPLPLPVERLRMPLEQTNLLLPVSLQSRIDPKQKWRHLTRGLFYRVIQQDKEMLQDELDLPGHNQLKQLKLIVDPRGGGLGGQSPTLQFGLRGTELVFLARGEQPYTLGVGKPDLQPAQLPLDTLMPGMQDKDVEQLPEATMVWSSEATARVTPVVAKTSHVDWKRIGLWVVLLAGVAVLAFMAWSLLKPARREGE
jgi:hypothetical protein